MVKLKEDKVLFRPEDVKPTSDDFKVLGVFNPGAMRLKSGEVLLYVRIWEKLKKDFDGKFYYSPRCVGKKELEIKLDPIKKNLVRRRGDLDFLFKDGTKRLNYISHLRRVLLDKDGLSIREVEQTPSFFGLEDDGEFGIEDPRIIKIGKKYIMTYVSLSMQGGISTSYAVSSDCMNWKRKGIIFEQQNKDVILYPEKINRKYVAVHRPEGNFSFTHPHMWICYSDDLEAWENPSSLNIAKRGNWDSGRVGAGPPPIKTRRGWLLLYHGVVETKDRKYKKAFIDYAKRMLESKFIDGYYVGAALFDLKNPEKLIAKSPFPVLYPMMRYEKSVFDHRKIIFPSGLVQDGKDVIVYSGGGDGVVSAKKMALEEIMRQLKRV
ncbi:MAG: hypothetical protein ABIE22_04175 [archaeon]